jgi:hypothetical protein
MIFSGIHVPRAKEGNIMIHDQLDDGNDYSVVEKTE